MGTEFKAASGRTINIGNDGSLLFGKANGYLSPETAFDAEEYFRAKRDEELGRWRWPINPDVVAHELNAALVRVWNERTGQYSDYMRNTGARFSVGDRGFDLAAAAYFEAHLERKPWEDAKVGQVWAFATSRGTEHAASFDGSRWRWANGSKIHPDIFRQITAGRRIWPEDAA